MPAAVFFIVWVSIGAASGNGWVGFFTAISACWFTWVVKSAKSSANGPAQRPTVRGRVSSSIVGQSSHPPAFQVYTQSNARAAGKVKLTWHGLNEAVQVGKYSIPGGLIYTENRFSSEPSAIDPSLTVSETDYPEKLPYYPCYSQFSPAQRAVYLNWLAAGRTDTNPANREIGYIFTFFYGLERRLFFDGDRGEYLATAAGELLQTYAAYGVSNSLSNYLSSFLHFWAYLQGEARYAELWPWLLTLKNNVLREDSLKLVLHSLATTGKTLPAEIAFDLMLADIATVKPSMALRRPGSSLHEIFLGRYRKTFTEGARVVSSNGVEEVRYRPGSAFLLNHQLMPGEHSELSVKITPGAVHPEDLFLCQQVWSQSVSEVKRYEQVAKHTVGDGFKLKLIEAMPQEFRTKQIDELRPQWQAFAATCETVDGHLIVKTRSLANFLSVELKDWLTDHQSDVLSKSAELFGYEIAPAPEDYNSRWRADQEIALIPKTDRKGPRGPNFLGTAAILQLAAHIATSNGAVDTAGAKMTKELVATSACTAGEREHLKAMANLLLRDADNAPRRLTWIIKQIPEANAASVARTLTRIAAADGVISSAEQFALHALFRQLHVPKALGAQIIREMAGPGEVVVRSVTSLEVGEAIPKPVLPAGGRAAFVLDAKKVEAIQAETKAVISMLSQVMQEPEEAHPAEPEPSASPRPAVEGAPSWVSGLEPQFIDFAIKLVAKDSWSPAEIKALAAEFHLIPSAALDAVNTWSEDSLGDFLTVGDDPVTLQTHLINETPA